MLSTIQLTEGFGREALPLFFEKEDNCYSVYWYCKNDLPLFVKTISNILDDPSVRALLTQQPAIEKRWEPSVSYRLQNGEEKFIPYNRTENGPLLKNLDEKEIDGGVVLMRINTPAFDAWWRKPEHTGLIQEALCGFMGHGNYYAQIFIPAFSALSINKPTFSLREKVQPLFGEYSFR